MKKTTARTGTAPVSAFSPPAIGRNAGAVSPAPVAGEIVPMGESVSQVLAGLTPMNGQNISVNVTSASPHLPFGEWVKRGVLSALGNGLMFFPRLVGRAVEAIVLGLIGILKAAAVIVLVPTLIWLGILLQQHVSHAHSVREGAASAAVQGGEALKGLADGARDDRDPVSEDAPKHRVTDDTLKRGR
jgi:hypothetical protein